MEDRVLRGFSAGIAGGIAMNIWSFISGAMNMTTLRISDWAAVIIHAHTPPFSLGETLFSLLGQLIFSGVLGIAFAYLVPPAGSRYLIFKGWLFSVTAWFLIYAVTTLFKVEGTVPIPLMTAIANLIASSVFGLVLAAALNALTVGSGSSARLGMVPAMKPLDDDDETRPR
ncbi:hypothetical protein [Anaeroselena agilis]|uniref:Uncharacterized protein n=1 Tax=Anaeroselena agilis TaxID=3063788 RepID=A0ABU3P3L3_9FIRM|nr:hypothetical protein [Selenomonadales bacterium 4137-cl]